MDLVRQRTHYDCGVAVLATISGFPYEAMARYQRHQHRGLRVADIWAALEEVTPWTWKMRRLTDANRIERWTRPRVVGLVSRRPLRRWGHVIIVADHHVYDPSLRQPCPVSEYLSRAPRSVWRVALVRA